MSKTTQFRAVMSAVNLLPGSERPRVVGLGPTHRAVGEMRSAGVEAQTLASFLHDTQLQQRSGETPDFSNTLFLLDESSMVGNTDMARAYALIAAGGGRAVASGDTDQLQAIAPGQPSVCSRHAVPRCGHHERDCAPDTGTAGRRVQPD